MKTHFKNPVELGKFAEKEGNSYPARFKLKGIRKQVKILRELFPNLKSAEAKVDLTSQPLPVHAEGWFAIPRWEKVGETYNEAVEKVLELFLQRQGGLAPTPAFELREIIYKRYLRRHRGTAKKLQVLAKQQKDYDILVVAAQFGLRHRGRSAREARKAFTRPEFGLGVFEVGCMLLTHPERLEDPEDLEILCPGDEYSFLGDGEFRSVVRFQCYQPGKVGLISSKIDYRYRGWGSASAFLR